MVKVCFMAQNSVYLTVYSAVVECSINIEWLLLVNGGKLYMPEDLLSSWPVIRRGVWSLWHLTVDVPITPSSFYLTYFAALLFGVNTFMTDTSF